MNHWQLSIQLLGTTKTTVLEFLGTEVVCQTCPHPPNLLHPPSVCAWLHHDSSQSKPRFIQRRHTCRQPQHHTTPHVTRRASGARIPTTSIQSSSSQPNHYTPMCAIESMLSLRVMKCSACVDYSMARSCMKPSSAIS